MVRKSNADYTTVVSFFVLAGAILALIGGILGRTKDCRAQDYDTYLKHLNKCRAAFYLFYIGILMVIIPVLAPIYLAWVEANSGNVPLAALLPF